jgi:hypothetical protein
MKQNSRKKVKMRKKILDLEGCRLFLELRKFFVKV